jgi:mRNA interferase RelE/StbE
MTREEIEQRLNALLSLYNVVIKFGQDVVEDLASYKKEQREEIIALIIKRGIKGPLIKPDGLGDPLHGELHGFTKIKPKKLELRIVYRPLQNGMIRVEVIAIGPRDKKKVYALAAGRIMEFKKEMDHDR